VPYSNHISDLPLFGAYVVNGSFLADHLPVTRDRIVFTAIEFVMALRFDMKVESPL
jgi:hypothetical protein